MVGFPAKKGQNRTQKSIFGLKIIMAV